MVTIETAKAETAVFEAYRIEVTADRCRILAADTEGIRRGLFRVENLMRAACGPFLPLGTQERKPFIKSRISCYFQPLNLNRPPRSADGLYYSDGYLNRMAHDGINGLWLGVRFEDIVKSGAVPEFGKNRDPADQGLAPFAKEFCPCRMGNESRSSRTRTRSAIGSPVIPVPGRRRSRSPTS